MTNQTNNTQSSNNQQSEPQLFPQAPSPQEHVAKHKQDDQGVTKHHKELNEVATRLKILEERYATLRKKMQLTEQSVIQTQKENFQERKLLSDNIMSVKKTVKDLQDKVSLVSEEINEFVDKKDFTILQRYIDFWEPMDFVTRKEVNDFLRKKFSVSSKDSQQTVPNQQQ